MAISPNSDLISLSEATRFLARRPWQVLLLGILGMGLSALAAWIQVRAGLPEDKGTSSALIGAALVPLELFFIPRFLLEVDAEEGGNPLNAAGAWKVRFEERWLRAFLAKVLLGTMVVLGASLLILPGLAALIVFGWTPLRVLLKGDPLLVAARGSMAMMAKAWRRVVPACLVLLLAYLLLLMFVAMLAGPFFPREPTVHQRITHPALWLANFGATVLSLWLSAGLLSVYRRFDT
jgi:hypothetical protein